MDSEPGRLYLPGMQGCRDCTLGSDNPTRIQVVPGYGIWPSEVMVIGEAPGRDEQKRKPRPFIGESGQLQRAMFAEVGWDIDRFYVTNTVKCHPPGNRDPHQRELKACRKYLDREIELADPEMIICVGAYAYKSLLPDEPSPITAIHGHIFRREIMGRDRWVVPMLHPAFVGRNERVWRPLFVQALRKARTVLETGELPEPPVPFTKEKSSWKDLVDAAYSHNLVGLDLEFDGPRDIRGFPIPRKADIVGVGIAVAPGESYYYPCPDHDDILGKIDDLKDFIESQEIVKVVSNVKAEKEVLHKYGMNLTNYRDTLIEAWLLGWLPMMGPMPLALKDQWQRMFSTEMIRIDSVIGKGKQARGMRQATYEDEEQVIEYAAQDPDASLRLHNEFFPVLQERGIEDLYLDIEMPFTDIIIEMEEAGFGYDPEVIEGRIDVIEQAIARTQAQIVQHAGYEVNSMAPQQVAKALYGESFEGPPIGRLPVPRWNPDTQKNPPTDKVTLAEHVGDPLVRAVLSSRAVRKLLGTYVQALPKHIDPDDGRIHCDINQTGTVTGRISSSKPNLTNIPARQRDDVEAVVDPMLIRSGFVPDPYNFIYAPDLSQIEMRIQAHLADCTSMKEILIAGGDLHSNTAAQIFHTTLDALCASFGQDEGETRWKNMRYLAKTIGFGVLYGLTANGLLLRTPTLELTIEQASGFINGFYGAYPEIRTWQEMVRRFVYQNGWYETMLGRRRYFPEISARDRKLSSKARNECVNFPIQGGAADYFKLSIIAVRKKLTELNAITYLVNQVHDEIVMEGPKAEAEMIATEIPPVMSAIADVMGLSVPVPVDIEMGPSWGELYNWNKKEDREVIMALAA